MLYGATFTSGSGINAASSYLDVVSNNIANLNTTGYKTNQINFQDLLYAAVASGDQPGTTSPGGTQVGNGTGLASINGVFTQGPITQTGRSLDLAISGNGLFAAKQPDGTTVYTRAGNLNVDAAGHLTTAGGLLISPAITIPSGTSSVSVGPDGTVTAVDSKGARQDLGQINLTRFQNPNGLLSLGNNLYATSPASGTATTGAPGTNGLGTVTSGALEGSNVSITNELVNLIVAQQTFLYNSQALLAENNALALTTGLIT